MSEINQFGPLETSFWSLYWDWSQWLRNADLDNENNQKNNIEVWCPRWQGRQLRTDQSWVQSSPRQKNLKNIFSCFWLFALEPMRSNTEKEVSSFHRMCATLLLFRNQVIEEPTSFNSSLHRCPWSTSPWVIILNEDPFDILTENISL